MSASSSELVTSSVSGFDDAEASLLPDCLQGASSCRAPQHDQWLTCDAMKCSHTVTDT
jgi:hypothetical protein